MEVNIDFLKLLDKETAMRYLERLDVDELIEICKSDKKFRYDVCQDPRLLEKLVESGKFVYKGKFDDSGIFVPEYIETMEKNINKFMKVKLPEADNYTINQGVKYERVNYDHIRRTLDISGFEYIVMMYSKKYNKSVVLTGERHINRFCDSLNSVYYDTYLYDLFKNTNVKIDFFSELFYTKKGHILVDGAALYRISETFKDCFESVKYCKDIFPNVRFHYADIRPQYGRYIDVDLEKYFKKVKTVSELELYNEVLMNTLKIKKQLNSIPLKIKDELNKFYKTKIRMILEKYPNKGSKGGYYTDIYNINKRFVDFPAKWNDFFLEYHAIFMDIYLLGRLFKSYISDNVIIHTGSAHTRNYVAFLSSLGFSTVYTNNTKMDKQQCVTLEIDKIPKGHFFISHMN